MAARIRRLVVFDGTSWFVRRVAAIVHDLEHDEKVYHCDKHLGGPFKTAAQAVKSFEKKPKRSIKRT